MVASAATALPYRDPMCLDVSSGSRTRRRSAEGCIRRVRTNCSTKCIDCRELNVGIAYWSCSHLNPGLTTTVRCISLLEPIPPETQRTAQVDTALRGCSRILTRLTYVVRCSTSGTARYRASRKVETMADRIISVQVREDLAERLDHLSHATGQATSFYLQQAIEELLALHEWQLQAIGEGIAAVERGDVVDHEIALAALRRWGTRAT